MPEQQTPSVEQQLAQALRSAQNLESVNREAKAICDGLIQRCATLACERDNALRDAEALRVALNETRAKLLDANNRAAGAAAGAAPENNTP